MDNTQNVVSRLDGNKRTALMIGVGAAVLLIIILSITLSVRSCINKRTVFTELHESRFHRENAGGDAGNYLYIDGEMQGDGIGYLVGNGRHEREVKYGGDICYSNEQIKADSQEYETSGKSEGGIFPGTCYRKFFYIENIGTESIYVRFTVEIPAGLIDMLDTSVYADGSDSNKIGNEACYSGEWNAPEISRYTAESGEEWVKFSYIRVDELRTGEMTYWSPWSTLQMNSRVSNEDILEAYEKGWVNELGEFNVRFAEQSIQSRKFDSAEEAFYALDNPDED